MNQPYNITPQYRLPDDAFKPNKTFEAMLARHKKMEQCIVARRHWRHKATWLQKLFLKWSRFPDDHCAEVTT